GATSIDELITAANITKSGFFYHFRDKSELARVLLARYLERESALFDDLFRRADELNEDPLHGFLVGLKMLAELLADLPLVTRAVSSRPTATRNDSLIAMSGRLAPKPFWPGASGSASVYRA
ncbi:MAG TPA: TetR/AcrR family transcriptional regulator, partial [Hyphomicrobium sp.]|nr:TetR/AcrR family transcriptional regulator [Hyphomicrobium sp.]